MSIYMYRNTFVTLVSFILPGQFLVATQLPSCEWQQYGEYACLDGHLAEP